MATRPVHEIRRGLIKVRIWRKRTGSGVRHSVSLVRLFRDGDQWRESSRLCREDLPLAGVALHEAFIWMHQNPT
jgi:hypothetical protein